MSRHRKPGSRKSVLGHVRSNSTVILTARSWGSSRPKPKKRTSDRASRSATAARVMESRPGWRGALLVWGAAMLYLGDQIGLEAGVTSGYPLWKLRRAVMVT